jgi:hypothetical protein
MWGGWGNSTPDPQGGPWYGVNGDSAYVIRTSQGSVIVKVDAQVCTLQQNAPGTCT